MHDRLSLSIGAILLLVGCYEPTINGGETKSSPSLGPDANRSEDAGTGVSHDAEAMPRADGGRPEPDAGEDSGPALPVKHASCALPLPSELPPSPPASAAGAEGEGGQCIDVDELVSCDPGESCPFAALCLTPDPRARGVCFDYQKRDGVPDATTILGYAHGACAMTVPESLKQAICCRDVAGFDCRGYTQPARPSELGELCHVHDDCEPGLLCLMTSDTTWEGTASGFGRCLCPGVDPATVEISPDCFAVANPAL